MRFLGFEWDEGNWPKCGKHGVTREEIELLFASARVAPRFDAFSAGDAVHRGGSKPIRTGYVRSVCYQASSGWPASHSAHQRTLYA